MKGQLKDREEVNGDQAAAKYIEVFALKVFNNADNEDRKGGSNRWGIVVQSLTNSTHHPSLVM